MKFSCNVVQDLLPLYIDKSCSEESKLLIEEHLAECPKCRLACQDMSRDMCRDFGISAPDLAKSPSSGQISGEMHAAYESLPNETLPNETFPHIFTDDIAAKKAFKKLRMHFLRLTAAIVAAVLLLIPLITLSVHQVRGEGICFTNLDDIYRTSRFLNAVKNGNYEKAFSYLDLETVYQDLITPSIKPEAAFYEEISVAGNTYYIAPNSFSTPDSGDIPEEEAAGFWYDFSHYDIFLIPEQFYPGLSASEYFESFQEEHQADILEDRIYFIQIGADHFYLRLQNKTDGEELASLSETELADMLFYQGLPIIPEELFHSILEDENQQIANELEYVNLYREMGAENFIAQSRQNFIGHMEEMEQNQFVITGYHFSSADFLTDNWQINFNLDVTYQNIAVNGYGISMSSRESGLYHSGTYLVSAKFQNDKMAKDDIKWPVFSIWN